jgi:hypothetical protein
MPEALASTVSPPRSIAELGERPAFLGGFHANMRGERTRMERIAIWEIV